ncbi:MAG: hypothetical protein FWG16_07735, partial [Micrococcales bacterium]|nr:hypothetical protein [Micrococcales bacterium]
MLAKLGRTRLLIALLALVVAITVVVVLATRPNGSDPEPVTSPTPEPTETATASPTASPSQKNFVPGPVLDGVAGQAVAGGAGDLTWQLDLSEVFGRTDLWVTKLVDAGSSWLVAVSLGNQGADGSLFLLVNAATGQLLQEPGPAELPAEVTCAEQLLQGQAVCAWDGLVYLVNPANAQVSSAPLVAEPPVRAFGLAVVEDSVIVAGLSSADGGAAVAAFTSQGEVLWSTGLVAEGCFADQVQQSTSVLPLANLLQVAVGPIQGVVDLTSGQVMFQACGRMVVATDGSIGLIQDQGGQTDVASSYLGIDGQSHGVCAFGQPHDALALEAGGEPYFGLVDAEQYVHLLRAHDCQPVWS